ncbi:MAG: DUF1732 domain-containing protein [Candidatus Omnitrophota bacterium]|nr:DUF1732 domain-containing protein [Candidatus Omnitrophota bacterium]
MKEVFMRSMTAYACIYKRKNSQTLQLILRSLNFKYLDIAIHNLPFQNIILEERIKRQIRQKISRGKIEVYVFLKGHIASEVYIDEKILATYIHKTKKLAKKYKLDAHFNISDFISLPQVISCSEKKVEESLILSAAKEGLIRLLEFKEKQGEAIRRDMAENLRRLGENIENIKKIIPTPTKEENGKEDINEEISLASFYLGKVGKSINVKKHIPQGKSLDFLTQEILRELNSASSKTKNKNIALLIVESKNYLERIREQAQNVE